MAVFSAGFVEYHKDKKSLRKLIYEKAKSELDSSAMKIATKGGKGFVNFIAFLPKERIKQQNILELAQNLQGKNVIVFELDYKQVGVICEDGMIIDYILDKPQIFAKERGYEVVFASNVKGQVLKPINLQKQKLETYFSVTLFLFFTLFLTGGAYGGYEYFNKHKTYEVKKQQLEKEYELIVEKNLKDALQRIEKVDSVKVLEDVEKVTKITKTRLKQLSFQKEKFCVQLLLTDESSVQSYDFSRYEVLKFEAKDIFGYCYEKI